MLRYIIKRILWLIPVIIAVSFIVFALMELAPGSVVDTMITESMTAESRAALMAKYDLDKPLLYRYGKYMFNLVQGNLGVSDISGLSVWKEYMVRLPATLTLSLAALVIGSVVSIPMGILAARRAGKITDNLTTTFSLIGMSMPSFWLGLLLLFVFSHWLRWLPAGGNTGIRSFILPALCSGLLLMATSVRQTRSSMLEVLNSDYLRTARSKGVPEKVVIRKHALGNAWIPILTTIGASLSVSLAGSAVIESVFAWPGVGRLTVDSVMGRDVRMTCGCVIMTSIIYVVMQLIVDMLYAFVDPRIRAQYASHSKKKKRSADNPVPESFTEEGSQEQQYAAVDNGSVDIQTTSGHDGIENSDEQHEAAVFNQIDVAIVHPVSDAADRTSIAADAAVPQKSADYSEAKVSAKSAQIPVSERKQGSGADINANPYRTYSSLVSKQYKKRSQLGEIFHRLKQNRGAMVGLIIVALLFLTFIGSLLISYESVTATNPSTRFLPPSLTHPFGTDNVGRDNFLRTIYGTRYSLLVGFGAASVATIIGVFMGAIAGYFGGILEDLVMRFADVLASIPGMLLGMVIMSVLGQNLMNLIFAVAITAVPIFIRMTRASVISIRNQEFVEASRAIGFSSLRIIFSQVVPNGLSPIIVTFTSSLGISIVVAAALSFLGFGIPVPNPEWGALISGGRNYLRTAPWLMTFPGLFIMVTVLALNLLGDGLRDALDPKLKK